MEESIRDTEPSTTTHAPGVVTTTASPEKPRRNLTQAFEALCAKDPRPIGLNGEAFSVDAEILSSSFSIGLTLKESTSLVSPTNVADFGITREELSNDGVLDQTSFPDLNLHPDLSRELSIYCINRVSMYSLIHDINKECSAMAQHDPLAVLAGERESPLVIAALLGLNNVSTVYNPQDPSKVFDAVIDEEQWLLSAIACRSVQETHSIANADCPSTFLQAMGEKEYENPVQSVTGHSRTQLWKPSRSWWEAKSGKNPWIEPASHNKRWRYLWPLIHYHKFLAKCIKKLKRNGVDVKLSISPVSVFLREEVCAVSDHLAAVSLFDSDEWMACLGHFDGWTVVTPAAEAQYREFVRHLPLRSLSEPGDVDSPILRSQIDENFLRAMVAQREQFRETTTTVPPSLNNPASSKKGSAERATTENQPETIPTSHNLPSQALFNNRVSPAHSGIPRHIHGVRRPRFFPQPGAWYGWDGQPFQDNSSVHSELSANSFPQQQHRFDFSGSVGGVYPVVGHGHIPPGYYSQVGGFPGSADQSQSSDGYTFNGYHDPSIGWVNPYMSGTYPMQPPQSMEGYYAPHISMSPAMSSPGAVFPPTQSNPTVAQSISSNSVGIDYGHGLMSDPMATPFKYDPDNSITHSPYWSHLDQATIAMGLATPAKPPTPMTPTRGDDKRDDDQEKTSSFAGQLPSYALNAPAPLLRQHYYSLSNFSRSASAIGNTSLDGFIPPSPATQFMMSPHAMPPGSFGYSYGYGFSPRRPVRSMATPRHLASSTIPEKGAVLSPLGATQATIDPQNLEQRIERQSPSTVEANVDAENLKEQ